MSNPGKGNPEPNVVIGRIGMRREGSLAPSVRAGFVLPPCPLCARRATARKLRASRWRRSGTPPIYLYIAVIKAATGLAGRTPCETPSRDGVQILASGQDVQHGGTCVLEAGGTAGNTTQSGHALRRHLGYAWIWGPCHGTGREHTINKSQPNLEKPIGSRPMSATTALTVLHVHQVPLHERAVACTGACLPSQQRHRQCSITPTASPGARLCFPIPIYIAHTRGADARPPARPHGADIPILAQTGARIFSCFAHLAAQVFSTTPSSSAVTPERTTLRSHFRAIASQHLIASPADRPNESAAAVAAKSPAVGSRPDSQRRRLPHGQHPLRGRASN
ncbi:hypothetical protein CH63R_12813 [Colletotrichum higginsianum IMI 349063]|uniref:Uncharacterized protein n=1 Tax=Colletotrichum higginsianum (strain IMI 349063) TaxID=759273 RepID=A0A1B7XVA3_COLHI|nr:hypothetical protein CH63R_12813 [Colletotrichum higginsianum IMI 349063]OBR03686.1 hypothetical protein CH63R_12813 [Colletotrichum higginsianum IMI 349063]